MREAATKLLIKMIFSSTSNVTGIYVLKINNKNTRVR